MNSLLLTGISQVIDAFSKPTINDPIVQRAIDLLAADSEVSSGLRYRQVKESNTRDIVIKKLGEYGVITSDDQLDAVMRMQEEAHLRSMTRMRFWVQVALSLLVICFAGGFISLGAPEASTEKALFGLLGTVLGYWLR